MSVAVEATPATTTLATTRGELLPLLVAFARMQRSRRHLPSIFSCIVLDGTRGLVWATDYDITISRMTYVTGDTAVIGLDNLLNAVKVGPKTKTGLATPVEVTITGGTGIARVGALQVPLHVHAKPEDYPKMPLGIRQTLCETNSDVLGALWGETVWASDTAKDALPVLSAVKLSCDSLTSRLSATATDRYRLARTDRVVSHASNWEAVVPDTITPYLTLLPEGCQVTIGRADYGGDAPANTEGTLVFTTGATTITQRLIEADYPRTDRVWPSDWDNTYRVNRDDLIAAVRTVEPHAPRNTPCKVALGGEELKIEVWVQNDEGRIAAPPVPALCGERERVEVGFNPRFLLDTLNAFPKGSEVVIRSNGPERPHGFFRPEGSGLEALLMPVR